MSAISRLWQRWTPAEDTELRERVARRESPAAIAVAMRRGHGSVRNRMKELGICRWKWTRGEDARIREAFGKVKTRQLAAELCRSPLAIKQRAMKLGVLSGRWLSRREVALIRRLYPTHTARQVVAELLARFGRRRTTRVVSHVAERAGLRKLRWHDDETLARVKSLHDAGEPVRAIAAQVGLRYDQVKHVLKRFGLAINPDAGFRGRSVAKQLRTLGLENPAGLRSRAYREFAASRGWPEDLKLRAVQILEVLAAAGKPMDRWAIAKAIGWNMERARRHPASLLSYASKGSGGSYLGLLIARGLVVRLTRAGRVVVDGTVRQRDLYTLSPAAIEVILQRAKPCDRTTA